jgi:hypothetical protein
MHALCEKNAKLLALQQVVHIIITGLYIVNGQSHGNLDLKQDVVYVVIQIPVSPHRLYKIHHIDA